MNLKGIKKEIRKAEKAGKLETWKTRIGLAIQLVEIGMMALAAAKGLKVGKAARPARASAKHATRRSKRSR